ncbi:Hypothetical protein GbCGDNIH7_8367 [Granulibacter bethesdensis]|nr:Hypothetical protein GbCGDNIH5_8165 [Granulibacter bethesdensis]APH60214.1 Hypothetical protein GbCGDNIH7_8367 [Granulibacter bethesdensis]
MLFINQSRLSAQTGLEPILLADRLLLRFCRPDVKQGFRRPRGPPGFLVASINDHGIESRYDDQNG